MKNRKREREILHNYMEVLASNYATIEPADIADSISKIYKALNTRESINIRLVLTAAVLCDFIIHMVMLIN